MKKTILVALFLGCITSFASAEMKAGITFSGYQLDAAGKESKTSGTEAQQRTEEIMGATASLFVEYAPELFGNRVSLGIDVVPYDVQMGSVSNVRNGITTGNQDNQSGTNSVDLEMKSPVTGYLLFSSEQGIYLKAGVSHANLKVNQSVTTGTSYPDQDMLGGHINIGYEHELDTMFVRFEVGHSEWETVNDKSSSGRYSVKGDLDGTTARISIGKSF